MDNKKDNLKNNLNGEPWWKPGMALFSQVSTWIIVPIILALVVGRALDKRFGTDPYIFLSLIGMSFLFSSYGIVRVIKQYMKDLKKIEEENKNKKL